MRRTEQGVRLHAGAFARAVTKLIGAEAFVLGRRIFLSRSAAAAFSAAAPEARNILEHELVHVEQFRRLGVLRFLTRYLVEYMRFRLRGESHADAYHSSSFEREAERSSQSSVTGSQFSVISSQIVSPAREPKTNNRQPRTSS